MKISSIILTHNNEATLKATLESVMFCDEIVVIDDFSSDKTLEIARKFTSKIFQNKLGSNFASQRNFGLSKASNDWVLYVDSDEIVTNKLKNEILNLDFSKNGYFIKRQNKFLGKHLKYGEWGDIYLLRLANKTKGKFVRQVHEYWDIKGETSNLKNVMLHKQSKSLSEFIKNINNYSLIHSIELENEAKNASFLKIIIWPFLKFGKNFLVKKGYLDGTPGFVIALLMSFHSFLAWSNVWIKKQH